MNDLLLKALRCQNTQRPPVWLMRQAGRYLPEYQAYRKKHSLAHLFHTPELAAEITKLPVDIFGVDAAILFSDILVIAEVLGCKFSFPESGGAFIEPTLQNARDIDALPILEAEEVLHYVAKTIRILKKDLSVPLIGFCGGPFTVASYLIEKGGKGELIKTKQWLNSDPTSFHKLLEKITKASIDYLRMQIKSGVDAIQIFDSWAGLLLEPQFKEFSLRYLQQIIDALKESGIPVILFCRGSSQFAKELSAIRPTAISFDWQKEMKELRGIVPSSIAVQGNLNPDLLREPQEVVKREVQKILDSMRGEKGFIFNLGHGVFPDVPVENVRCLVDAVKSFAE